MDQIPTLADIPKGWSETVPDHVKKFLHYECYDIPSIEPLLYEKQDKLVLMKSRNHFPILSEIDEDLHRIHEPRTYPEIVKKLDVPHDLKTTSIEPVKFRLLPARWAMKRLSKVQNLFEQRTVAQQYGLSSAEALMYEPKQRKVLLKDDKGRSFGIRRRTISNASRSLLTYV
ncbi:MAG: hypothetical protein MMC23_005628 [Stictis urceolatum]|nr:hypothetical protein [Stictis urceolata]